MHDPSFFNFFTRIRTHTHTLSFSLSLCSLLNHNSIPVITSVLCRTCHMKVCVKANETSHFQIDLMICRWQYPVMCFTVYFVSVCVVQWKREQEFDLQLLERAVQGEEAQGVRSVQGEETPPEHNERQRSHSDEWLTLRSTATASPAHEVDLEPLDYDLDLNKEVSYLCICGEVQEFMVNNINIMNVQ